MNTLSQVDIDGKLNTIIDVAGYNDRDRLLIGPFLVWRIFSHPCITFFSEQVKIAVCGLSYLMDILFRISA